MPPLKVMLHAERALLAAARADTDSEGHSAALSRFMVRSESVASSKIERIDASARDYAKALAGNKGNTSATGMVAASAALHELITKVGESGHFELDYLKSAHRALMADDPQEADDAGRLRDRQTWIGGSDHSPRGALHVPPAPLIDLFALATRAAAECSRETIARLKAMPALWAAELKPRTNSAAAALIQAFYEHPVMRTGEIEATAGSPTAAYRAIDQLVDAGLIEEITGRKKDRVWAASEVIAELDDLDRRIEAAMHEGKPD